MHLKTEAIVLKTYKYSETAIIAKIYTKERGLLSFMVHGVRKKKSKFRAAFFQVLQGLILEINYKEKSSLNSIKEVNILNNYFELHTNIYKSTIAQFIGEFIFKSVQEQEINLVLFDFINNSTNVLDEMPENEIGNFHIVFLLNLSRFLGFYPNNNFGTANKYFCIETGEFEIMETNSKYFDAEQSKTLSLLLKRNYSNMKDVKISSRNRNLLLHGIILFYQNHLPEMGEIQSLEVLEAIFE